MVQPKYKAPCWNNGNDCENRCPGCHSSCPKYQLWRAMVDIGNEKQALMNAENSYFIERNQRIGDQKARRRKQLAGYHQSGTKAV